MLESDVTSVDEERQIGIDSDRLAALRRNNRLSFPKPSLQLDEEQIFEAATDYNGWVFSRFTLEGLPAFDNSATFGITQADENIHIRHEIKKFVQFLDSDKPPLFNSYGALHGTNAAGYEDLYNIVDQIRSNIQVIRHDNGCLAFEHYIHQSFYGIIQETRSNLRRRYLRQPRGIVGHNPNVLEDETRNMRAYHSLIDYIFHSLAWWLMHVAERKSWHVPIIAILARWSVKLKLIALDPVRWAEQSLARGEDMMRRISEDRKEGEKFNIEIAQPGQSTEPKKVDVLEHQDLDYQYYASKTRIREVLYELFSRILGNLIADTSRKGESTAFEVRTLLYRDDLDQTLRQLTVQQNGSVVTSSDITNLRYSYRALQLLLSNSRSIPQTDRSPDSSESAKIIWRIKLIKGTDLDIGSVTTARLDDVISILVPVGMMGGSVYVRSLKNLAAWLGPDDDLVPGILELPREESPRIEFSLTTRSGEKYTARNMGYHMVPTSQSPLIASMEDVTRELEEYGDIDPLSPETLLKSNALKTFTEYKSRMEEIKSWALTEDSVRVHTTKYSSIILMTAVSIIGGFLSVPFLVGERIAGVDPFQFVTLGWLLAGAFLVGAKSRYVENWPWHDFLRGQILCRSVSELAVASRIKKQAVLLYLLHQEFRNPLLFRGPCHGPFHRRAHSATGGFNIDVPVEHATILAAGFIVLEVHTKEMKVYTVLHDTREGTDDTSSGKLLISDPIERTLIESSESRKLGYKEEIRLNLDKKPSDSEVVGLPTADCIFV